ncbi:S9 family peptidase [Erythrobacteraceae bacterium CFH 75059]|nr:S9 family peptidase [Erythrobacteraceae bacterium CFH 75059]
MSARDLVTLPRLGAPVVAPDAAVAVVPVTMTDSETLARSTRLQAVPLAGTPGAPVDLALPAGASSPAFAGDGFLYFLAPGGATGQQGTGSQVWRVRVTAAGLAGTPAQVTRFASPVAGFSVAPQGNAIAVWRELPRGCVTFDCTELPAPASLGSATTYDARDGFVRHWDRWTVPGSVSRVFVHRLADGVATGEAVTLDGPAGDGALVGHTPTRPFGGAEDVAWAPDGRSVYFVARRADGNEPRSTNLDIWRSDLSGRAPENLTSANTASDTLPVPSPDGRWLAYLAMARPGYESDRQVITLRDLRSGAVRALTGGFDRSFGSIAWTPDSRHILATAQDVLDTPAFRIVVRTGRVERLDLLPGNEAHVGTVVPLPGNRLLFTRDSIAAPPELFLHANRQTRQLTDVATTRIRQLAPVTTRRFSFAGAGGAQVWGQITKPEGASHTLPAILYIHGGPQGSFNDAWSNRWNPRVTAAQGYAVISIDFHGSTGYGQDFVDAINRDWGGKPLADLQKGLAAALALDPQIDGSRACAMGASYGGYMVNWIAGQWPDRFRCLVNHNGLFDMRSFYYATEETWFPVWDFGGTYEEQRELYERWNPVNHVGSWRTPMMVVIGQRDFRVPYTQGLGAFHVLQERQIPGKLLVFPDENHWVLGARNSLRWHDEVFAWLDRWLKRDGQDAGHP